MGKWLKVGFAVLAVLAVVAFAAAQNAYAVTPVKAGEDAPKTPEAIADEMAKRQQPGQPPAAPGDRTNAFQVVTPQGMPITSEAANTAIAGAFGNSIVYPLKPSVTAAGVTLNLGQVDGKDVAAPTDAAEAARYNTAKAAVEAALKSAIDKGRIDANSLANQEVALIGGESLGLKADVDANGNVTAVYVAHPGHGRSQEGRPQRGYLTAEGVNFLASNGQTAALEAILVRELNLRQADPNATDAAIMAEHTAEEKAALTSAGPAILAETQGRVTKALAQLRSTIQNGIDTLGLTQNGANAGNILGANVIGAEPINAGQTGVVISTRSVIERPEILGVARGLAEQGIPVRVLAQGDQSDVVAASATAAGLSVADNMQQALGAMPTNDVRYIRTDAQEDNLTADVGGRNIVSVVVREVLANIRIQGIDAWFRDIQLRHQAATQK